MVHIDCVLCCFLGDGSRSKCGLYADTPYDGLGGRMTTPMVVAP